MASFGSWVTHNGYESDSTPRSYIKFKLNYSISGNTITFTVTVLGTDCSTRGNYNHNWDGVSLKIGNTVIATTNVWVQLGYSSGATQANGLQATYHSNGEQSVTMSCSLLDSDLARSATLYISHNGYNTAWYTGTATYTLPEEMFQATTFTLTLDKDSGFSSTAGGGSYEEGTIVNINATIKSGYTWSKWTGNTSYLTGGVTTQSNSVKMPAAAVTLKATSTANIYKVNWNGNGGTSSVASNNITFNSTYTLPTATRAGHTFKGWYTAASGGTQITASTKHTTAGDVTYYAQWAPWTFTVKYEKNTGEGSMSDSSHTHATASTLTVCTFEKPGYSFLGWNTAADGSGNQYADNDDALAMAITEAIADKGNITLYAQWGIKGIKFYYNGEWVIGRVKIYYNGAWY